MGAMLKAAAEKRLINDRSSALIAKFCHSYIKKGNQADGGN
jgi:hypothetical protein